MNAENGSVDDASLDNLQRFYTLRGQRPVWTDMQRVEALATALKGLASDGLVPSDYHPDRLLAEGRRALGEGQGSAAQQAFESEATGILLTAMAHLQRGKVDPHRIDEGWEVAIAPPSFDLVSMSRELDEGDVEAVVEQTRPSFQPYRQLRTALAQYQNIDRQGGWPVLAARDEPLRPGDTGADVATLRRRLGLIGEADIVAADASYYPQLSLEAPDADVYDPLLAEAVRRFQRHHLLADDGVVGPDTRLALNVPVSQRIDQIRANMERARWLLHGLPKSFVLVDIAGYRLTYFRPDGQTWRTRIVVGQPYRRTPTLRSEITYLTLNPTWTVPPTIYREDILPKVRNNPDYLASRGLYPLSPSGTRLDPHAVDWSNPGGVMLRQGAGASNPLGRLVIRFPNDHLVYLHDTPSRHLFNRAQRALSSGCIRVEGVTQLAQMLFDDSGTSANVSSLLSDGQTRNVSLERRIPIVLNYWTVQPESDGSLAFRPDIYHRDADVVAALDRPLIL
ncbi:peptidase [Halomonas huangheensis]|nr:peptidase [Halomonas huangheensis]